MSRSIAPGLPKFLNSKLPIPVIYLEGGNERYYLSLLVNAGVIRPFKHGLPLDGSDVKSRIESVKKDIYNEAIEQIIWIVDGGDDQIKKSDPFYKFYVEWLTKKSNPDSEWKKLSVLINQPSFEFWYLLHRCNSSDFYADVKTLFAASVFYEAFPKFNKKDSSYIKALIQELSLDSSGRKKAINMAKEMRSPCTVPTKRNFLKQQLAEMYQLFEPTSNAYIGL